MLENFNPTELFQEQQKQPPPQKVNNLPSSLRSFIATIHFLSPLAYQYIISVFKYHLPEVIPFDNWCESINGLPGFTSEVFKAIMIGKAQQKTIFCSLIIDEIQIKRSTEWHGNGMLPGLCGYINLGNSLMTDSCIEAKEALVFMLVGINVTWKTPIAYFLCSSLTGAQKYILANECIKKVEHCGIKIVSITFDGSPSNTSMATQLGCNLNLNVTSSTGLPVKNRSKAFYDPSNMLHLIRMTFFEEKILPCSNGNEINWQYIKYFYEIGYRNRKEDFFKDEFKLKLATDHLSTSVADGLAFYRTKLRIPEFQGSEETETFIRTINNCFDILNSRTQCGPMFKKPISWKNIRETSDYIRKSVDFLKSIQCRRNLGFKGFLIDLQNCIEMYRNYIEWDTLICLPMYKLSLNHLDVAFSSPEPLTAKQFQNVYKNLLPNGKSVPSSSLRTLNATTQKHLIYNWMPPDCENEEEMKVTYSPCTGQSIASYGAGVIISRLEKKLECYVCLAEIIVCEKNDLDGLLIGQKTIHGPMYPSRDMLKIVKICEQIFKSTPCKERNLLHMTVLVLRTLIGENVFEDLYEHMFDTLSESNHFILLIKVVIEEYFNFRLHHETFVQKMTFD